MWAPATPLERFWLDAVAARDASGLLLAWATYLKATKDGAQVQTLRRTGSRWGPAGAAAAAAAAPPLPPDGGGPPAAERLQAVGGAWRLVAEDLAVISGDAVIEDGAWAALAAAWPRVREHERARALTTLDEVTGLFNTRHLHHVLEQEVARCRRFERCFSVLFVDLDRFKAVNDSLGHAVGTRLLADVGELLQQRLRSSDHAFRYGGDEFVVCLVETPRAQAVEVAERIRTSIAAWAQRFDDIRSKLTASIGVACFPDDGASAEALIVSADQRMYAAKRAGRNAVQTADLMRRDERE